jgi:hypothetical protein
MKEDRRQMKPLSIKNFYGGPGGGFYKKSPLAAGGENGIYCFSD